MTDVTVKQFSEVVGVPTDRLLVQLGEAGLAVSDENAVITDSEKTQLLDFLRKSHGKRGALSTSGPSKISLKRKTQSELRAKVPAGRGPAGRGALRTPRPEARTVTVEVRKKRTYVKRADLVAEEQERLDREAEEKAKQQAELQARDEAERKQREEAKRKFEEEREAEEKRLQAEREARQQAAEEARKQSEAAVQARTRTEAEEARGKKAPDAERKTRRGGGVAADRHTKYGRKELEWRTWFCHADCQRRA
jgi:translation initiation factor IF-2